MAGFVAAYDAAVRDRSAAQEWTEASIEAERLTAALDAMVSTEVAKVGAMAELVRRAGLDDPALGDRFDEIAAAFLRSGSPIRSVQLAPDAVLRHVYPLAGNEQAVGLDLLADPERVRILEPSMTSGMATLQGPFDLVQGGVGLIVRKPIFTRPGEFWGFVAILLDWPSVAADVGLDASRDDWLVGIRETRQSPVLVGSHEAFTDDPVTVSQRMGGTATWWTVAVRPPAGWSAAAEESPLIRFGGLLVALLAAVVAYMITRRPELLEEQREAAVADLARSEARFQAMFLHAGAGIAIADGSGRLTAANPAFGEIMGSDEMPLGIHVIDQVVDEDRRRLRRAIARVRRTGKMEVLEMRITTDRGQRWGRLRLTTMPGPDRAFVGIIEDITDQRTAESALAESEERFRMLVEHAPIGIQREDHSVVKAAIDAASESGVSDVRAWCGDDPARVMDLLSSVRIIDSNPEADLLHRRLGKPFGRIRLSERFTEATCRDYLGTLDAMASGDSKYEEIVSTTSSDGSDVWLEVRWRAPVVDGRPDYSNVLVTLRDITETRMAEQRLHEEIASKDRFIASVAHELRTPLTAVVGFAHELQDTSGIYTAGEREEFVDLIAFHSAELAHLIEDLLVWARADIGEVRINSTSVDVGAAVSETIAALPGVDIPVLTTDHRPLAFADPRRLGQILRNLATNAIRYGGPDRRIHVFEDGGHVVVEVSDDGPSMTEEAMERVFAPYERAVGSRSMPGSIGLGLTVSRTLSVLQSGNLTLERRDGRTVFRLVLPAAGPGHARSRQSRASATTSRAAS